MCEAHWSIVAQAIFDPAIIGLGIGLLRKTRFI